MHESAEAAQDAFYAAFEGRDIEAMMDVWSSTQATTCIHPHGPRLVGLDEIRSGWEQILTGSPPMRFEIETLQGLDSEDFAVRMVNEHIYVGRDPEPQFTVMATNVFLREADGWRIVEHHASPFPDALADEEEANLQATLH